MAKIVKVFPVNEKDEIVAQKGTGTGNVVSYISQEDIPVDESTGKMLINVDMKSVGGIGGLDGLICKASPLSNAASGTVDVYTVPVGRKMYIAYCAVFNPTGSAITTSLNLKVSGNYYNLTTTSLSIASNVSTYLSVCQGVGIVLEAGETLSVINSAAGLNFAFQLYEFNAGVNFKTYKNLSLSSGNNTLYTTPIGKSASLGLSQMNSLGTGQPSAVWNNIGYSNNSGSSQNIYWSYLPKGGSNIQLSPSATVTTGSVSGGTTGFNLQAEDSIVFNTSSNTAGQMAWVNVFEI